MIAMFKKHLLYVATFSAFVFCSCTKKDSGISSGGNNPIPAPLPPPTPQDPNAWRAAWVTNVASTALNSRDNIRQCVAICKQSNINHIFMVVYNNATTLYPSQVMQNTIGVRINPAFAGRDPLAEMIAEAQAQGIKVHAWFEYGFAAAFSTTGGPIIQAKPNWASNQSNGSLTVKNDFAWLNAYHPEVQQYMIDLFKEVVTNYPTLDGVQGDDRLPACPSEGGYEPFTRNLYAAENGGAMPPANRLEASWLTWRAGKLNAFLRRLRQEVKAIRPNILFTMSPSPFPWGYNEYIQDWPTWVREGLVDRVIPQCYRREGDGINNYTALVAQQKSYLPTGGNLDVLMPGIALKIGTYLPSQPFLGQMIQANRNAGFKGESFFFYEGVKDMTTWFINQYPLIR
jgi:uncharacterized lipoprotein YddW (UPF0748 family)